VESAGTNLVSVTDTSKIDSRDVLNSTAGHQIGYWRHGRSGVPRVLSAVVLKTGLCRAAKRFCFAGRTPGRNPDTDGDSLDEMIVWDHSMNSEETQKNSIRAGEVILWKGYCSGTTDLQWSAFARWWKIEILESPRELCTAECRFEVAERPRIRLARRKESQGLKASAPVRSVALVTEVHNR